MSTINIELEGKLSRLLNEKVRWEPAQTTHESYAEGAAKTLSRALSLRILEIPVGDFVDKASQKDLPIGEIGLKLLRDNIKDEEKHDLVLNRLIASHPELVIKEHDLQAKQYLEEVLGLEDHPICKARVLEVGVFFIILPILRYFGSQISMYTGAAKITEDERVHVAANWAICETLGITPSKRLNNLRREIVAWLTEDAESVVIPENRKKSATGMNSQRYWLKQSDSLSTRGKAEDLKVTQRVASPAFFEIARPHQDTYGQN